MSDVKVVLTEQLACGHFCSFVYPMKEVDLTLKTGPIFPISPPLVFPYPFVLPSLPDATLELSGKYGDVQYSGIIVKDGRFVCTECTAPLFAINKEASPVTGEDSPSVHVPPWARNGGPWEIE